MPQLEQHPDLYDFCEQYFSSQEMQLSQSEFVGWDHAESLVWRLESSAHETVYLKTHRQPRKFVQEHSAYLNWLPNLPGELEVTTPQMLAVKNEGERSLLLSSVPGRIMESIELSSGDAEVIYYRAGKFLAALHQMPIEDHDICPAEAMQLRLDSCCRRAQPYVDAAEIGWVQSQVLEALPVLKNHRRVACHRDFTPRNWVVARETNEQSLELSVIDFEHSRPDLFFLDIQRLWSEEWPESPSLAEAFWDGYGRGLTDEEMGLLVRCSSLVAITTIAWSREHGDEAFERSGRRVLEWLKTMA